MQNKQVLLSYSIVLSLAAISFLLSYIFILASQPDFYSQLEMTLSLGLIGIILALISFDYLTKLPLNSFSPLLGAAIGSLFFINVLGLQIVDPTQIEWVMQGDLAQNYFGWQFFRQEAWQQPLGKITSFYYPIGSSILYTDSLPLLALPLKLLSSYLPTEFQYIGAWILLSYILQGVFASLLLRLLTPNLAVQALGIGFFVWSPILLGRVGHFTLTTHWLLLAGLWLYFRTWHNPTAMKPFLAWLILVSVSALAHPYLAIMIWALAGAFYLRWWFVDGHGGFFSTTVQIAMLSAVTLSLWWVSGLFLVSGTEHLSTQGFGYYSMNLFAPLNSYNWSLFMQQLPTATDGQYEGYSYFGIGMWLVILWAMYELKRQPSKTIKPLWPLLSICLLLTLLALSHKITLLGWTVIHLPDEWVQYFTPFRSSARFFWVTSYTLLFLALSVVITRNTVRTSFFLLSLAFSLQVADLYTLQQNYRYGSVSIHFNWDNKLDSPKWSALAAGRQQLLLIPPPNCGVEAAPYRSASYLASQHQMLVNTGQTARFDTEKSAQYCRTLSQYIDSGFVEPNALYIVNPDYLARFQQNADLPLDCQQIDGFWGCITLDQQKVIDVEKYLESDIQ